MQVVTQMVVERELAKSNITRHDLGGKFIEKVWEWKDKSGTITNQLRALGASQTGTKNVLRWMKDCQKPSIMFL